MSPTVVSKLLVITNVVVLGVGMIDAGVTGQWDLFVVLVVGVVISASLLIRLQSKRPAIPIRRDLVVWLRERAAVSGESLSAVTDRAIATFADRYGSVRDAGDTRQ